MSKRMIDLMYQDGFQYPVSFKKLQHKTVKDLSYSGQHGTSFLPDAEVFVIDNVTEYMYAECEQEYSFSNDFPNVAPPYPVVWMETRQASGLRQQGIVQPWDGQYAWGVALLAADATESHGLLESVTDLFTGAEADTLDDVKWVYTMLPFLQQNRSDPVIGPIMIGLALVCEDGSLKRFWVPKACYTELHRDCTCSNDDNRHYACEAWWCEHMETYPDDAIKQRREICQSMLFPFWLALSFLHCGNVASRAQDPCHPAGKRNVKQPCKRLHYKVLDIHPMRQALSASMQTTQAGLKTALHSVRGHFADYRQGGGLFGKHHGLYWFNQHTRGASTEGMVVKDYAVHSR